MNNSQYTVAMAQGIYFWAVLQDMKPNDIPGSYQESQWITWAERYPIFVEPVKKEQFNLFDRCLHGRLGQ